MVNASSADRSMIYRNEAAISLDTVDTVVVITDYETFRGKARHFPSKATVGLRPRSVQSVFVHRFSRKLLIIAPSKRLLRGKLRENLCRATS